ncbi:MAG: hypothetical protein V1739_06765 [Candidatus Omnitrophota bacterium]
MYRIKLNIVFNTLELHLQECFDTEQGRELFGELSMSIHELKPGFKLLTDLSELRKMDFDAHQSIDEIMELCNKHNVSKVVRVITKDSRDIGFNIMSLFHYSHRVIIHTCDSLEKAQKEIGVF